MIVEQDRVYTRKWEIIIILGLLVVGLSVTSLIYHFKITNLKAQFNKDRDQLQNMVEQISQLEALKEKLTKDNEKYQADSVSYFALNAKLSEENGAFEKKLKEAQKLIETQEAELERAKNALDKTDSKREGKNAAGKPKAVKEREALIKKVKALSALISKERELYHYNLGVAFSQAKFYDDAIREYEKSLEFNSHNPDAHYNLGLLFDNYKNEPKKAVFHYRKYLEFNSNAPDKEEVESWLKKNE